MEEVRRPKSVFDPTKLAEQETAKRLAREGVSRVKDWAVSMLSEAARVTIRITVNEVQCGDPSCAPIDTTVEFWAEPSIHYGFGIPKMVKDITIEDVRKQFPSEDIVGAWARGEDAEWPKPEPPPNYELLFNLGDEVDAYLGRKWRQVKVTGLWHRETHWPKWAYMPYKLIVEENNMPSYAPCEPHMRARNPSKRLRVEQQPNMSPHEPAWRFNIGDKVEVLSLDGWQAGEVSSRDVSDPGGLEFALIPYVVLLEPPGQARVMVPFDDELVIRPLKSARADSAALASESHEKAGPLNSPFSKGLPGSK